MCHANGTDHHKMVNVAKVTRYKMEDRHKEHATQHAWVVHTSIDQVAVEREL